MPKKSSKFIITAEWLEKECACSTGSAYALKLNGDAAKIYRTCPRGDWLIWLLRHTNKITLDQARQLAVLFAEMSLPFIAKRFPDEKRPALCVEAVKTYLAHPTEANKNLMLAARCEARKAYWNMWGIAADADAADADAADADADDAAAAAAAAAAAWILTRQTARHHFYKSAAKIVREIVKNPFL